MKENKAYDLYHKTKEFISLIKREGYNYDSFCQISSKGNNSFILGEINNGCLVLYTRHKGGMNKFFDKKISELQKLAEKFNAP